MIDESDALLVAGSSLTVMSGLRFARYAHRTSKTLVVVNRGATRADHIADLKIDHFCGVVLPASHSGDEQTGDEQTGSPNRQTGTRSSAWITGRRNCSGSSEVERPTIRATSSAA